MANSPVLGADSVIEPLSRWLAGKISGARNVELRDVVEPSQGYSNTTICFVALWTQDGVQRKRPLVARIQRDTGCPMLADIFHQWRVMEAIGANSNVAVPRMIWAEPDPGVLGAPFYIMERVDGRAPPDFPSYHAQGWVAEELSPGQRERIWWNGVEEMARLHQIDWRCFDFLANGASQAPGPEFYIEHFIRRWYEWAAKGRRYPVIETAIRHMLERQPPVTKSGLVWNDARMGNTMFAEDLSVAALVDYDVATLGPAEIDLGWWLYAEDIFSGQFGLDRLAGVPDRATAIKGFERIYGRPMPDFDYYEALAVLKHAVISIQSYENDKLDQDQSSGGLAFATKRLSQYLNR